MAKDQKSDRDIEEGKRRGRIETNIKWLIRCVWLIVGGMITWIVKKAAE